MGRGSGRWYKGVSGYVGGSVVTPVSLWIRELYEASIRYLNGLSLRLFAVLVTAKLFELLPNSLDSGRLLLYSTYILIS